MNTKILKIENLLTIKIVATLDVFKNIENYFPNTLHNLTVTDFDYEINYRKINTIPNMYKNNINCKCISPFRNSKYILNINDQTIFAYAEKQKYSEEHLIIKNNKNIDIMVINDKNNKTLIRLITELIIRKLLENGYFPLHASCVVSNNKAIVYFGDKSSGKSTALFSSVLINNDNPLANDITFIGNDNGIWKAFGTSYDLTFDKSLIKQIIENKISFQKHNFIKQFSSNKIRYTPKDFCGSFNTTWQWSAPIKDINIVRLSPEQEYKKKPLVEYYKKLEYLVNYGKDNNFFFDDILMINQLSPIYNYEQLATDVEFNEIEGNILKYQKNKKLN